MNLLYLVLLFPLISFLLLAFSCNFFSKKIITIIGVGSIGLSTITSYWVAINFIKANKIGLIEFHQKIFNWISLKNLNISISFNLDILSLLMLLVITTVSFLIHLYASWYMNKKQDYKRFFSYTNLFVANMLLLILSDNLLLMYFGWEGVGICSYMLISFYYYDIKKCFLAMKAFIITRIGDILLLFGLFILNKKFGTLNFHDLFLIIPKNLLNNSVDINLITLMILGGALGKSAQLPLQTWLSDAMVGPTPVSALIHAATMVTAGVYLILRTHILFYMSPKILNLVGIIGAITLIIASLSALVQTNIKKILAYSTMSQIGYMFLSIGSRVWDAAIFHLINHSFFKALLFLSSGSIIIACNNEQNIFKMGGLKNKIPLIYFYFLVGGASLTAFPLITSSFFSKENILLGSYINGYKLLFLIGLLGTFLTSIYIFRMIFIIFHGKIKIIPKKCNGINHTLPLIVLSILSSYIITSIKLPILNDLLKNNNYLYKKIIIEITSSIFSFLGIFLAVKSWLYKRNLFKILNLNFLKLFILNNFGFDFIYNKLFVIPFLRVIKLITFDPIDKLMYLPVYISFLIERILIISNNGKLRWYLISLNIGTLIVLIILNF